MKSEIMDLATVILQSLTLWCIILSKKEVKNVNVSQVERVQPLGNVWIICWLFVSKTL